LQHYSEPCPEVNSYGAAEVGVATAKEKTRPRNVPPPQRMFRCDVERYSATEKVELRQRNLTLQQGRLLRNADSYSATEKVEAATGNLKLRQGRLLCNREADFVAA
jgi:hypothetical protein